MSDHDLPQDSSDLATEAVEAPQVEADVEAIAGTDAGAATEVEEVATEVAPEPLADVAAEPVAEAAPSSPALDLDAIERDLADVEVALSRLDAGTYWTDEVTGEAIPAERLAASPTARRA